MNDPVDAVKSPKILPLATPKPPALSCAIVGAVALLVTIAQYNKPSLLAVKVISPVLSVKFPTAKATENVAGFASVGVGVIVFNKYPP